ncbi:hypothetical protein GUJ93_ZPchr0015g6931 [Zizania palustris]|uniref:Uncharacterized protein n=1 Tax=Zizania palustris TaxID=103762 RepID=A0A8J5VSU4_ZIZPA|nr:hypothetical protein GUJ93_ZPchr0015g6931 [Zizania palustris]
MAGSPHQGDGNECVSKYKLGQLLQELNAYIVTSNQHNEYRLEWIERNIATLIGKMENLERQSQPPNDRAEDIEADGMNQYEYV